jgi:nocturnin
MPPAASGATGSPFPRELTPLATCAASSDASYGPPLTVLSWNVLADGLAQHGRFTRCPPAALEWAARRGPVLEEILAAGADVVCLQEVNKYDELSAALSTAGYRGAFFAKPSSPAAALGFPADGCALFWRRDRLELMSVAGRPFAAQQAGGVNSVQGLLLATFADTSDRGRPVAVACVHLKAKAGPGNDELRGAQAADAAAALRCAADAADAAAPLHTPPPLLLLAGDFNAGPASEATAAAAGAGFASVWGDGGGGRGGAPAPPRAPAPPAPDTTYKWRDGAFARRCSDYIFVAGGEAVAVRRPPRDVARACPDGLPCAAYPSDHIAVVAAVRAGSA